MSTPFAIIFIISTVASPLSTAFASTAPEPSRSGESTGAKRFYFVDAWRGIAALWVMLHHFYFALFPNGVDVLPASLRWFFEHGDLGVEIFFVLSGFVITHSLLQIRITSSSAARFALRRSLRLDPLYWSVIVATLLLNVAQIRWKAGSPQSLPSPYEVLLNFLYLDNLCSAPSIVKVGWTLCLEIQFYLVCLALMAIAQGRRAVVVGLTFVPLIVFSLAIRSGVVSFPYNGWFLPYWCMFAVGMAVAAATNRRCGTSVPTLLIVALAVVGCMRNDPSSIVAALFGLTLLAAVRLDKLRSLNGPIVQYFGKISYSLYLIHPLVGNRFLRQTAALAEGRLSLLAVGLLVAAFGLSLIAAETAYRLIERPSHRLSRKIRLA